MTVQSIQVETTSHSGPRDGMFLAYSGWCTLVCQPVAAAVTSSPSSPTTAAPTAAATDKKSAAPQFPFHALAALEEGFFSDMEIVSDSGRSVRLRRIGRILKGGGAQVGAKSEAGGQNKLWWARDSPIRI